MIKRWCVCISLLLVALVAGAQEVNCKIQINSDQIQGTNKQVFSTLQDALSELINNRKWSEAKFAINERVECTIIITIKEVPEPDRYKGDIQIQSKRPVYNTNYTTTLINFKDNNFEFQYRENEPLTINSQAIENNLTAVIAYYIYMILGIDADSFAPSGGAPFFEQAEQIVNMAQSTMEVGWKAFEDTRNRHGLVTAFTDPRTAVFRQLWYDYHRQGLDAMALSPDKGRGKITSAVHMLNEVHSASPTSVLLPLFSDAKLDELINIYSKSSMTEKEDIYNVLNRLYPTEGTRLQEFKKEKR